MNGLVWGLLRIAVWGGAMHVSIACGSSAAELQTRKVLIRNIRFALMVCGITVIGSETVYVGTSGPDFKPISKHRQGHVTSQVLGDCLAWDIACLLDRPVGSVSGGGADGGPDGGADGRGGGGGDTGGDTGGGDTGGGDTGAGDTGGGDDGSNGGIDGNNGRGNGYENDNSSLNGGDNTDPSNPGRGGRGGGRGGGNAK